MIGNEPKNYIEFNGQKYDATTGRRVNQSGVQRSLDGLTRRPGAIYKPQQIMRNPELENKHELTAIRKPKHIARGPQRATTLMRPAVKKPKHAAPYTQALKKPPEVKPVPHARLKRAQEVEKSQHISRFRPFNASSTLIKRVASLPVANKVHIETQPIENLIQPFEDAIENATSHLEVFVDKNVNSKKKKFAFAVFSFSFLIIASFAAYQVIPDVKVKVAGTKAGFSASLPSYSPAGFGLSGPIKSSSGEVGLTYQSRTDDKSYKIIQSPSDWNSQSLASNFLLSSGKAYQTYENNGNTIYVYDGSNATWVDGGKWYQLEGDASLTSDQLLRIANSL